VNAGDAARRAQRLNVTRSVRDFVPLCFVKIVRASTRCTPLRIGFGFTGSLQRLALFGFDRTRTTLPSIENTTRSISRPLTVTLNAVPWQPVRPPIDAAPRAHSSPPAGAGPGGVVQTPPIGDTGWAGGGGGGGATTEGGGGAFGGGGGAVTVVVSSASLHVPVTAALLASPL
jgi:uncharacterized membrane protein YgcG